MGENNENEDELNMNGSDGSKITVKGTTEDLQKIKKALLDAQSIDKANEALIEENSELKGDLETIAEKQLNQKVREYGINPELDDEEKIAKIKEIELEHSGTAPLNYQQTGQNPPHNEPSAEVQKIIDHALIEAGQKEYPDLQSMFADLNERAGENRDGDPTTNKILDELTFKSMKGFRRRELVDFEIDPKQLAEQRKEQRKELAQFHKKEK